MHDALFVDVFRADPFALGHDAFRVKIIDLVIVRLPARFLVAGGVEEVGLLFDCRESRSHTSALLDVFAVDPHALLNHALAWPAVVIVAAYADPALLQDAGRRIQVIFMAAQGQPSLDEIAVRVVVVGLAVLRNPADIVLHAGIFAVLAHPFAVDPLVDRKRTIRLEIVVVNPLADCEDACFVRVIFLRVSVDPALLHDALGAEEIQVVTDLLQPGLHDAVRIEVVGVGTDRLQAGHIPGRRRLRIHLTGVGCRPGGICPEDGRCERQHPGERQHRNHPAAARRAHRAPFIHHIIQSSRSHDVRKQKLQILYILIKILPDI